MSITFQKPADQHSEGSLLLGALFGGLTSEVGQMADLAMDTAEIASEFHSYNFSKKHNDAANQNTFKLGQKNSIGSLFSGKSLGLEKTKPAIQKRYLEQAYQYNQKPAAMALAA